MFLGPLIEDGFHTEPGEDGTVTNFWPIGNSKHMLLFLSHKRAALQIDVSANFLRCDVFARTPEIGPLVQANLPWILDAQRVRGIRPHSLRGMSALLSTLFIVTLRTAQELSLSLETRAFRPVGSYAPADQPAVARGPSRCPMVRLGLGRQPVPRCESGADRPAALAVKQLWPRIRDPESRG